MRCCRNMCREEEGAGSDVFPVSCQRSVWAAWLVTGANLNQFLPLCWRSFNVTSRYKVCQRLIYIWVMLVAQNVCRWGFNVSANKLWLVQVSAFIAVQLSANVSVCHIFNLLFQVNLQLNGGKKSKCNVNTQILKGFFSFRDHAK